MSDSPMLHTGYGKVAGEIWSYLHNTGKYEIACIGFFHPVDQQSNSFPIYPTSINDLGEYVKEDRFGLTSFPKYVEKFKPDLVWTCGDTWMLYHVAFVPNRDSFRWIGYVPIDGEPIPSKWGYVMENMDIAVAFGQYGMKVIEQKAPKANLAYIYHGVNPEVFYPLSEQRKGEIRKELGIDPSKIVIGVVARNQPRKSFDKIFEAFFYLVSGSYIQCNACQKISVYPHDLVDNTFSPLSFCSHCKSLDCQKGRKREDLTLYIHGTVLDAGWDLFDLQRDYQIGDKVHLSPELKVGVGISEEKLNEVFNSFDIFTLPTRGEGFGLPILEAMSASIPVVVTDYSAHPEWAKGCGELVPPICLEAEVSSNIRRAIINMDQYVEALLKLIEDPKLRKKYGSKGRKVAEKMNWKGICKEWENLIDQTLLVKDSL